MGTTSLASLDAEVRAAKQSTCGVRGTLDRLDKNDRATLEAWLADATVQHSRINAALGKIGIKLNKDTIGRHRRGECSCR